MARPRVATNQRDMATNAVCAAMPWPKKLSPKMASQRTATPGAAAMARQLAARPHRTKAPRARTR